MKADEAGQPVCEQSARGLGVRVPRDIACSPTGTVLPRTGGMSVAPANPMHLAPHRRPSRLGGTGRDPVFMAWHDSFSARLVYRSDIARTDRHGFIEPHMEMDLRAYRTALCDSRPFWRLLP